MKKIFKFISISTLLFSSSILMAQDSDGGQPYSFENHLSDNLIATSSTPNFDFTPLIALSEKRVKQGTYELTDKLFDVNYDLNNSGTWTTLANGDRLWKLKILSPGAKKLSLYFKNFYIPEGARLFVYNQERTEELGAFTSQNNSAAHDNDGIFSTDHLSGDAQFVEYYEPKAVKNQGDITIFRVAHQFKSMMGAESCQIDVMCPDGTNWQNQKQGVVRIYVVIGSSAGYCSGSLVNNTAADCKKYILTAMHCSLDESTGDETTVYNQWKFYFNYEKSGCAAGPALANKLVTGCQKRAGADDGGGSTGSDFLLVEMTASSYPTGITPYYNGWTRATNVTAGGVGIHHPAGDCKKISTFTATPTSSTWGGNVSGTHWKFVWEASHGSTEPGSSGSPVFNSNGLIFGTLTGGGSCCIVDGCGWQTGDAPEGPTYADSYGKVSMHWTSNGTTAANQLKPWLDPTNSGVTTLAGSFVCTPNGIEEHQLDNYVTIYPNPNNGLFNISVELGKTDDLFINVYNIVGQTISNKKVNNTIGGTYSIDLTTNPSGIYFVEIKTNDSRVVRKINLIK
jgi:hypothetical protein